MIAPTLRDILYEVLRRYRSGLADHLALATLGVALSFGSVTVIHGLLLGDVYVSAMMPFATTDPVTLVHAAAFPFAGLQRMDLLSASPRPAPVRIWSVVLFAALPAGAMGILFEGAIVLRASPPSSPGAAPSAWTALRTSARRWPQLLVAMIGMFLVVGGIAAAVVATGLGLPAEELNPIQVALGTWPLYLGPPALYLFAGLFLSKPTVLLANRTGRRALRESWERTKGARPRIALVLLALVLLVSVLYVASARAVSPFFVLVGAPVWVSWVPTLVLAVITLPPFSILATVLYEERVLAN